MDDKRKHPRTPCNLPLSCVQADGSGAAFEGAARDIGPGGMFVESAVVLKFGTQINITVRLPGMSEDSTLPAVVRWAGPGGFGVMFGLIGARDTHAITELMH